MKLSYRGVNYEQESLILEVTTGEVAGKYRGHNWTYQYPRHITQLQPKILRYRGVAYSTRGISVSREESSSHEGATAKSSCPVPIPKQYKIVDDVTTVHLENMRRNLERRLQVAKENGNENLVNLLQQESRQLAL